VWSSRIFGGRFDHRTLASRPCTKMRRDHIELLVGCLCLPCIVLYELYHLPYKLTKKAAAARKYRASIQKALPLKRRRLSSSGETPRSVSNALFLNKLPLEIRLEIYRYVLGGQLLHIVHRPKRLAHMFCCTKVPYSALFYNPDNENISCSFTSQRAIICDTVLRPRNTKQCSYRRQQYLALPSNV